MSNIRKHTIAGKEHARRAKEDLDLLLGTLSMLGAGPAITAPSVVARVQRSLHQISIDKNNPVLDPYHDKYKDDGVIGSKTRSAVAAFNITYADANDGSNITQSTLDALDKIEFGTGTPAAPAPPASIAVPAGTGTVLTDQAQAAQTSAQQAQTPAQVQAAGQQTQQAAANPSVPPEVKKQADDAKKAADQAKTPAQVQDAKKKVEEAAKAVEKSVTPWYAKSIAGPVKTWHLMAAGGGALALTTVAILIGRGRK